MQASYIKKVFYIAQLKIVFDYRPSKDGKGIIGQSANLRMIYQKFQYLKGIEIEPQVGFLENLAQFFIRHGRYVQGIIVIIEMMRRHIF